MKRKIVNNSGVLLISFFVALVAIGCSANQSSYKEREVLDMACDGSAVKKSSAAISFILSDLNSNYKNTGGGGITSIKLTQTNVYEVSIAQEERIDKISYEFEVDSACKVKLIHREESTLSFGH